MGFVIQQHQIIDSARIRAGVARERAETAITELLGSGTRCLVQLVLDRARCATEG